MKLVKPKKFLGQHFLKDLKVAQDIADTVDACPGLPILEVGPGMGVLTQFLVRKERPVKVVELDYESVAYLREEYPSLEDNIIEDDFLKMNLQRLFDGQPFVLTGNYPYNISSQIFFKMLDNKELIPCCTGMIQKEVAERIAAGPGSKTYGILSILIQAWYRVEYLFTVHEHVFNPPPKVKSAVIRMTRNETKELGCDEKLFKQVVKTTFNQRRKTLRNSIKPILGKDCPLTEDVLFNKRPEQLSKENQYLHKREAFLCNQLIKQTELFNKLKTTKYIDNKLWQEIKEKIDLLFDNYTKRLCHQIPSLTDGDIQICCLIKLRFSNGDSRAALRLMNICSHKGIRTWCERDVKKNRKKNGSKQNDSKWNGKAENFCIYSDDRKRLEEIADKCMIDIRIAEKKTLRRMSVLIRTKQP